MRISLTSKIPNSYTWAICIYNTSKTEYIKDYFLKLQNTINQLDSFTNIKVSICFQFVELSKPKLFSIQGILNHQKDIMPYYLGSTIIIDGEDHFPPPWNEITDILERTHSSNYPSEAFAASIPSFKVWTLLQRYSGEFSAKDYALFLDNLGLYSKNDPDHFAYILGGYAIASRYENEINELHINKEIEEYSNVGACIRYILKSLCDNHHTNLRKIERRI